MTAAELIDALRGIYPKSHGWIVLPQVRDATGWKGNRTADAIALNAWPSRGMELHGFELKTYRGDWQRELKQPEKAESIFRYCDRWWLVTPGGTKIVRDGELPPTWGHILVTENSALVEVQAPKLAPAAFDRAFVAAVFRQLAGCETPEAKLSAAYDGGKRDGIEAGRKIERGLVSHLTQNHVVRWKVDSLVSLEDIAERTLKAIRRELADVRTITEIPPTSDEDATGEERAS